MSMLSFRSRITDIIISIMAKGHINNASINKVLNILQVTINSNAVLNTQHYALQPHMLVHPQVTRSAGNADIIAILTDNHLNLVENTVSVSLRIIGGLRQISHHNSRILTTFGHLMKVDKYLSVTMVKVYSLREKHRSITMGIESQYSVVGSVGLTIALGLTNEPSEQRKSFFHTLRMPLNAKYRLKLSALHCLNYSISRFCNNSEFVASLSHCLMME